jgi:hypothetical protein
MASARPRTDETGEILFDWINYFPVELPGLGDNVADLSALISLTPPESAVAVLMEHKIWEMTDEAQQLLSSKLSGLFFRDQPAREALSPSSSDSELPPV